MLFSTLKFLISHLYEKFIRNNGFMGTSVEILFHKAIVFDLNSASVDSLLEQHPSGVFFVPEQLADGFSTLPVGDGPLFS